MNNKEAGGYRKPSTQVPVSGFESYIIELAGNHGVAYKKAEMDELAGHLTRLSDDEIVMDDIECLIVALVRRGIVTSEKVMKLHHGYLREKFHV